MKPIEIAFLLQLLIARPIPTVSDEAHDLTRNRTLGFQKPIMAMILQLCQPKPVYM